jgi:hypothetical protein
LRDIEGWDIDWRIAYLFSQADFGCESNNLLSLLLDHVELARSYVARLSRMGTRANTISNCDAFAAFP